MSVAVRIPAEAPDFSARSVLTIAPGLWEMRNGHTARVEKLLQLDYLSGGKPMKFPVWKGLCVECNEPRTWNVNGTYAAVGKHGFDILRRAQ